MLGSSFPSTTSPIKYRLLPSHNPRPSGDQSFFPPLPLLAGKKVIAGGAFYSDNHDRPYHPLGRCPFPYLQSINTVPENRAHPASAFPRTTTLSNPSPLSRLALPSMVCHRPRSLETTSIDDSSTHASVDRSHLGMHVRARSGDVTLVVRRQISFRTDWHYPFNRGFDSEAC
jgi:hypothetical protein